MQTATLALTNEIFDTFPTTTFTATTDLDGGPVHFFNLHISQHPISGQLTLRVRPGSPLDSPTHLASLTRLAQRHDAIIERTAEPTPKPKTTTRSKRLK